jgi:hypothetical protein
MATTGTETDAKLAVGFGKLSGPVRGVDQRLALKYSKDVRLARLGIAQP